MNKILCTISLLLLSLTGFSQSDIKFDTLGIHKTLGPCKNKDSSFCFKIDINYPIAISGDTSSRNKLNRFITKKVILNIFGELDSILINTPFASINDAVKYIVDEVFKDTSLGYTDPYEEWENILGVRVRFQGKNYITLVYDYYQQMGGAHGLELLHLYSLDKKDFHQLTISDVVTDTDKLNAIGEKLFRQQYNIAPNVSITNGQYQSPYNFPSSFYLSKNFCIINDTLVSHYNDYEIAGYDGIGEEFNIPFTALANILKEPFKHEIAPTVK